MPYRKLPRLAAEPDSTRVDEQDSDRYPNSRRRQSMSRKVRVFAWGAVVLALVGAIALLPASAFGGTETPAAALRRTELAYVLLLLALAAGWFAWLSVGRSEVRLRRSVRVLGRVPLIVIAPLVAFAVLLGTAGH